MRVHSIFYFVDVLLVILLAYMSFKIKVKQSSDTESHLTYFKYYVPKSTISNDQYGYLFEAPRILKSIEHKKFITVALTADMIEDEKRLNLIRFEARRLKYTNDTNQIIKVYIPDSSRYETFLSLLYIMNEDHHKRYFEYQNWFYIFGEMTNEQAKESKYYH